MILVEMMMTMKPMMMIIVEMMMTLMTKLMTAVTNHLHASLGKREEGRGQPAFHLKLLVEGAHHHQHHQLMTLLLANFHHNVLGCVISKIDFV